MRGRPTRRGGGLSRPSGQEPYGRVAAAAPMPRTRRQAVPPLDAHDDRARKSWKGRPRRAAHPLTLKDQWKGRSLRSRR